MKKKILILISFAIITNVCFCQDLSQTIRGRIIDTDSKMPLPGATVVIPGSNPFIGTTTDNDGIFRLEDIPVGRMTIKISYMGYETKTLTNIIVSSAKQVVLDVELQESFTEMDEIVIKGNKKGGNALNDMALLSSRSISPEETKRYAGSHDDPSHILTNFAGVTSSQDGNNDIIIRGNAPKYVQWRLEGIEITNPSHQSDQNSTVAGFNALNNKLLSASDFYTGAFSSEYGNVLSGIYSVKLRSGNNEKFEAAAGIGIMGTDMTLEGPFKKGYTGSFLINYRYSTIGLIQDLGLADIPGISTTFQDATFKIVLPTKTAGRFSFFGLGGLDNLMVEDLQPSIWETPGDRDMLPNITEDFEQDNYLGNIGMNHILTINKNSYFRTTLAYSARSIDENIFESEDVNIENGPVDVTTEINGRKLNYSSSYKTSAYKGRIFYNNKINAKNKIRIGTECSMYDYRTNQSQLDKSLTTRVSLLEFHGYITSLQNFVSWKHSFKSNLTLVSGLHNMNLFFNNKSTLEPRIALLWKINSKNSFHAGYGNHSTMERIHNYFTRVQKPEGGFTEPNKDLDFLRAHHYIAGYERQFTKNIVAKLEIYYQDLYNLPVENNDTSHYATINESSDYRYVDLVNKGTGKNYGLELTIERYFNNHYYFLINGTLFNSKYTSTDGIERNTKFNNNALFNLLVGKEFDKLGKKQNKTLTLNAKIFYNGGQRYIPLLRDENGNLAVEPSKGRFWDYKKAYNRKMDVLYELNLSVSYKINLPKVTHELYLDLPNLTNHRGKMSEYYDTSEPGNIGYIRQMEFLPNFMYRIYF